MEKIRLDVYLFKNQLCKSRSTAKNLIESGKVLVNNLENKNPSYLVSETDQVQLVENEKYVSRGAYKLLKAIEVFQPNIENKICLDIGSSTGGFTQVLLENNAKLVFSLDVGTNQLDPILKSNPKVVDIQQTNFKDVTNTTFNNQKIEFIVCDVSFISATKIIEKINELKWKDFEMILLYKPQFEVGKAEISKHKGLVKDEKLKQTKKNEFKMFCQNLGFTILNEITSPIKGNKLENEEFLIYLRK